MRISEFVGDYRGAAIGDSRNSLLDVFCIYIIALPFAASSAHDKANRISPEVSQPMRSVRDNLVHSRLGGTVSAAPPPTATAALLGLLGDPPGTGRPHLVTKSDGQMTR